jgi:uncharacterized caspase-like protein
VTLQSINAAFDRLADQVKENDVFVLFLAGHGIVLSDVYHFIPADAIYRNEQALREASLYKQRLQDLLKEIRAQKSLLILDTCYAGAASKLASLTTAAAARGDLSEKTAITKLMRATGRAVLAASSDKQLALEGHQGHGFFTFALLQGLKGQADLNKNGEISTLELAQSVRGKGSSGRAGLYRRLRVTQTACQGLYDQDTEEVSPVAECTQRSFDFLGI